MFGQKKQTAWFFDSSIHLEAVSRLLYLIDAGESFGVICGSDGCGRTRVLARLREEVERTGKFVVSLNVAGLDTATALTELVTSISSSARRSMGFHELVPLLRDELAGRAHCGMHSVRSPRPLPRRSTVPCGSRAGAAETRRRSIHHWLTACW